MIEERTLLVTGASTGIGHYSAHVMKRRGWRVFATARKPEDLERLKAEGLEPVALDYTDEANVAACADQVLDATGGRLDGLFNNGAYGQLGALEDVETDHLRAQFEANFFGWHDLTRRILPAMRAQGSGRIVQCSSVLGFVAFKYRGPYNASKFALEGYTDTLRLEVKRFGIKVISIQPGPIESAFRTNARRIFEATIPWQTSAYSDEYQRQIERLRSTGRGAFELGPEAVSDVLIKALEDANPRPVYRVTKPTHAMAALRRVLPTGRLHAVIERLSDR